MIDAAHMKYTCRPSLLFEVDSEEGYQPLHRNAARERPSETACWAMTSVATTARILVTMPSPRSRRGISRIAVSAATIRAKSRPTWAYILCSLSGSTFLPPPFVCSVADADASTGGEPRLNKRCKNTLDLSSARSRRRIRGSCSISGSKNCLQRFFHQPSRRTKATYAVFQADIRLSTVCHI